MTKLITRNESTLQEKHFNAVILRGWGGGGVWGTLQANSNLKFLIKNVLCGVLAMGIIFLMEAKKRAYFLKSTETIFKKNNK